MTRRVEQSSRDGFSVSMPFEEAAAFFVGTVQTILINYY